MENAFGILQERGFVQQCTNEAALTRLLSENRVTYYVGYDPTADSLHAGTLLPIMAMAHLQRAGHTPIAIIGGGTTMVGDPGGKTEMRPMMSREAIEANGVCLLAQLKRYLDLSNGRGAFLNNVDWLTSLNYIQFLRDIGRHFRVNEMIRAEAYRQRLEREEGLSFIEFNYQLLQAYDFLHLFDQHSCVLQLGGDDQWGNILAGVDLIRRMEGQTVHALTFPLLTTAGGEKMGKTVGGAVWLDADRTSPYEFYQYWINTDDRDVERFLAYFTFLPITEVRRLGGVTGAESRTAKEVLAYEVTKLAHGTVEAEKAREASHAAFGGEGIDLSAIPTSGIEPDRLAEGISIIDLFHEVGLATSRGEARRLIQQGGAYINGEQVSGIDAIVTQEDLDGEGIMLRSGKKRYHRVTVE
jgi:tyrosyl-tRNA synthetase